MLTPHAMRKLAQQCRASCSVIGSRPTALQASFARRLTVDFVNGSDGVRPKTSSRPLRLVASPSARYRRGDSAIGTVRVPAALFGSCAPWYSSQPPAHVNHLLDELNIAPPERTQLTTA